MSLLRGLFVTGTDTGVGKTAVSAGLLRYARRRGRHPVPSKPAETGCNPDPEDAQLLAAAAGGTFDVRQVCPFRLRLPAAPAQAAQAESIRLSLDEVAAAVWAVAAQGDLLIVEGAGGLLVPYGPDWNAADLIDRLGLPALVVARTALGTINHSALTVSELRRRDIPIAALLLNQTSAEVAPHEPGSFAYLAAATGLDPLGPIPWLPEPRDPDVLADALEQAIGRTGLDEILGL